MIVIIVVLLVLLTGSLYLFLFRYPVIFRHTGVQRWSVGIGCISDIGDGKVPSVVISHEEVKERYGIDDVADPFLIKKDGYYYLFVEQAVADFGKIGVFKSPDIEKWKYLGVVLEDDEHMSYPQVFNMGEKIYMLPENKDGGRVALYKAIDFPHKWEKIRDVIPYGLLDVTIVNHGGKTYLFGVTGSYELRVFVGKDLISGDFKLHPASPLGFGEKMRPAGTPFYDKGKIIIPVQSRKKGYGYSVYKLIISELTPEKIRYRKGAVLLEPFEDTGYFKEGVHHISYIKEGDDYLFALDGRRGIRSKYWRKYSDVAFENMKNDIKTFFMILKNNYRSKKIK